MYSCYTELSEIEPIIGRKMDLALTYKGWYAINPTNQPTDQPTIYYTCNLLAMQKQMIDIKLDD